MAVLTLKIRGNQYQLSCGEGEESKLIALAEGYDKRLEASAKQMPISNESLLFILTGILMQDRINDLEEALANGGYAPAPNSDSNKSDEEALCESVDLISQYIEGLASKYDTYHP